MIVGNAIKTIATSLHMRIILNNVARLGEKKEKLAATKLPSVKPA